MDEREADYLRHQVRELEWAKGRWKALALAALAALTLFVVVGGGALVTVGVVLTQRMRLEAERARDAEMAARMQAQQALQAEQQARRQAEEAARKAGQPGKPAEPGPE